MAKTTNKDAVGGYIASMGMLQIVKAEVKKTSANYLCRIIPGKERTWLDLMGSLLQVFEKSDCEIHLCRKYVLKNGKMVYAWNIGFKGNMNTAESIFASNLVPESLPGGKQKKVGLAKPSKAILNGLQPRSPSPSGPDPEIPPGTKIAMTIIKKEKGADGSLTVIEEMPLPNVYRDLNVPKHAFGKGAKGAK